MRLSARVATAVAVATLAATPAVLAPVPAAASVPAISAAAFGMHYLNTSHAYPPLAFGTARIWDMGVTWADLQPRSTTPLSSSNAAVRRLDGIVAMLRKHHVEPVLTLGMTPAWAAHHCNHVRYKVDWGIETCAPASTSSTSPWGKYVRFLASHYKGKVRYFELWNEPSLANGYNDSVATLARLQGTAYSIVHKYGAKLISPGVPFTNGSPKNGYNWLRSFLSKSGGRSYDITGLHLYPADGAVRASYGPEWSVLTALAWARKALSAYKVAGRPIWDTEHNVGRAPAKTGYHDTVAGAAAVARTYLLATQYHVARTIWYGADDRGWGGTWLEKSDFRHLSTSGTGYRTVRALLVGKAPLGCTRASVGSHNWRFTCRYGTTTGHRTLLAIWTTGGKYVMHAPRGTSSYYTVTGAHRKAGTGKAFTITGSPVYLSGSF